MKRDRRILLNMLLTACLAVFLTSCFESKITQENYEKIQNGMTLEQVKAILGEPTQSETKEVAIPIIGKISGIQAVWKNPENTITISIVFANDKVRLKTFDGK